MEDDRAETNLGPELPESVDQETHIPSKTPRKRFVGRRAVAEKAITRTSVNGAVEGDGTLQSSRPSRAPRTLNQVPASILQDEALNAAIAHLPTNYNFEIHKTIHRIRSSSSRYVALQFPEGLLMFAPLISDIITQFCPGTDTLIMGDVTYGACCIDDYTARALGCDLLVHYGHSCLVPVDTTKGIKTLYVFVTIGIDTEHLINTIERNFQPGKKIALVGTIQFNATLHSITPRLRSSGYETMLPRSAPLSAGEILGCTAPSVASRSSRPSGDALEADLILYVGDGRFHLESILIASPTLRAYTYRYDPYTRRLTHETYDHKEMHSLRRHAIQTARKSLRPSPSPVSSASPPEPKPWGLILGTLGRQGNPHTLSLITTHLTNRGIPYITLLLSEIHPAKLALMSKDVAAWVQIACPRLSIDWGYAFERPLLSPYEACVALDVRDGVSWVGDAEAGGEVLEADGAAARGTGADAVEAKEAAGEDIGVYPMDFYEKSGLGRTTAKDVPPMEVEVV